MSFTIALFWIRWKSRGKSLFVGRFAPVILSETLGRECCRKTCYDDNGIIVCWGHARQKCEGVYDGSMQALFA